MERQDKVKEKERETHPENLNSLKSFFGAASSSGSRIRPAGSKMYPGGKNEKASLGTGVKRETGGNGWTMFLDGASSASVRTLWVAYNRKAKVERRDASGRRND